MVRLRTDRSEGIGPCKNLVWGEQGGNRRMGGSEMEVCLEYGKSKRAV